MYARYNGTCNLCAGAISVGEEIGKWLNRAVHLTCRGIEIERRKANLEGAIQLPDGPTEKITGYGYTTGWSTRKVRGGQRRRPKR